MAENLYSDLPKFLYKYWYFDEEGKNNRLLTHNELFCSSPGRFNDPFDCAIKIDYASGTVEQKLEKMIGIISEEKPHLPDQIIRKIAQIRLESPEVQAANDSVVSSQRVKDFTEGNIGVYSLTENENDLLMWAHYTHSHTGFLVEFDALNLKNFLTNFSLVSNQRHMLFKVKYSDTYEVINPFLKDYRNGIEKYLLTKSQHWSYEQEWRIIYVYGADKSIEIPREIFPDIITRVIVGLQIDPENQKKIINALSSRKVRVQKAVQSDENFELIYEDI